MKLFNLSKLKQYKTKNIGIFVKILFFLIECLVLYYVL